MAVHEDSENMDTAVPQLSQSRVTEWFAANVVDRDE